MHLAKTTALMFEEPIKRMMTAIVAWANRMDKAIRLKIDGTTAGAGGDKAGRRAIPAGVTLPANGHGMTTTPLGAIAAVDGALETTGATTTIALATRLDPRPAERRPCRQEARRLGILGLAQAERHQRAA